MKEIKMQNNEEFLKTKIIPVETFSYYKGCFHDGSIETITCIVDELVFEMQSCQIFYCWNRDRLPLSDFNTIYGRLHAKGIIGLKHNDQPVESLKMKTADSEILDLELSDNRILIFGIWNTYQPFTQEGFKFEVLAKEIYWENTANTTDPALLGKYLGLEGPPPFGEYPQWYIDKYGPQDDEKDEDEEDPKNKKVYECPKTLRKSKPKI